MKVQVMLLPLIIQRLLYPSKGAYRAQSCTARQMKNGQMKYHRVPRIGPIPATDRHALAWEVAKTQQSKLRS